MRFRQEVLNVALAEILDEMGLVPVPEGIIKNAGQNKMPDVLVEIQGLRLMIEGEVGTQETAAVKKAANSAKSRIEGGLAHIALGVVYPEFLVEMTSWEGLKEKIREETLLFRIFTESKETEIFKGNPRALAEALRRTVEELAQEDVVKEAVTIMEAGLEVLTREVLPKPGVIGRFAIALGISPPESKKKKDEEDYKSTVAYVGALSLLNAMIFHEVIASHYPEIPSLKRMEAETPFQLSGMFNDSWKHILENINYYPIFHLARELILDMTSDAGLHKGTRALMNAALKVVGNRAALRHDLAGRIYHRLLANAKYMGTFYTSIPAATLLLKLALSRKGYPINWLSLDEVGNLRIADLACGTGTLLMAAADAITDNHIRASVEAEVQPQVDKLQKVLMEKTLWGFDILPSAVHLTASTLALRAPETPVKNMNLFCLPLGGDCLGSVDFLKGSFVYPKDLFGALVQANQVHAHGEEAVRVSLPDLDLCVMNPPFTRSVGGNLLFGWLPAEERAKLQNLLKKIIDQHK
ncbi:MAG: N-6 DNA methylase, partial [Candidatus Hydrothermia bacterium]